MPALHKSRPAWGLGDLSPFVVKVQVWCDLKGLTPTHGDGAPNKAPKGKIPWWVEDDGQTVCDSSDILAHLIRRHGPLPGDAVHPHDSGRGHLVRRLLEEHVYWGLGWHRWAVEANWPFQREGFLPLLPPVVGPLILGGLIYRQVHAGLRAHGLGRHTPAQIGARLAEDFAALAEVLGDDPYFGGADPGTLDASAWAMLASILEAPHRSPVYDALAAQPRLVAYVGRFRGRLPTAWPGTAS